MNMKMKRESSLTPEEVADLLRIKKNTVYELIKRGELPAYRIGRKVRVDAEDLEVYKNRGKRMAASREEDPGPRERETMIPQSVDGGVSAPAGSVIIAGQDIILDVLSQWLNRPASGMAAFRRQLGSFDSLHALYHGTVDTAAIHLWDGDTGTYNISYVRRLLPGIPALIVHLASRMQGFYVASGNPLAVLDWQDLVRPGIRFVNREKGSGSRVLLDEKLRKLGLDRRAVDGYEAEQSSSLAVAGKVAAGEADVGMGNEKAALQVRGVEFVPVQKERYELVILRDNLQRPEIQMLLDIVRSREFREAIASFEDYEVGEMGRIVAEI